MSKKFWQFRNEADGDNAELILYGDISNESWFGDEITPRQFSEELDALGNVSTITVRINSGGGDVFAAQAIGNRLEQHAANVTARIDGLCASAATIIACHCNKVIAANDSVYMVHPVKMGVIGYLDEATLTKYIGAIRTVRDSIVSLYARKTGRDKEEVAALMDNESWLTGEQAKDEGFVDELAYDNGSSYENRNGMLFVNSINMNLPFDKAPGFIREHSANISNSTSNTVNHKEEEEEGMAINSVEELRNEYPELVNQIIEQAQTDAVNAERARIRDIEEMSLPGSETIANDAKFVNPISAEDYAKAAIRDAKARGTAYLNQAAKDAENSGVNAVKNEAPQSNDEADTFLDAIKAAGKKKRGE